MSSTFRDTFLYLFMYMSRDITYSILYKDDMYNSLKYLLTILIKFIN